ncbi:MAG: methylated-DNA--[protein]-cysteine S-methyltransferase [Chloroflexi bacterium]|nr:methylated-DNA--[protein]-cysteine S-methyltransferase [Chloroflexota bacterium]
MESFHYTKVPSPFGGLAILWRQGDGGPEVHRILLPNETGRAGSGTRQSFVHATPASCSVIASLGERIQRCLEGEAVEFDLAAMALDSCSGFQRRVLLADYGIPRGWVSTYGRVARSLGCPAGGRAVGGALAHNPFPIVIPCHRVVRANLELGGFGGGLAMKRALLELEGLKLSESGQVLTDRIFY